MFSSLLISSNLLICLFKKEGLNIDLVNFLFLTRYNVIKFIKLYTKSIKLNIANTKLKYF